MKQILHYKLEECIGDGTEGIVYRGKNTLNDKEIAAKELEINAETQSTIKKVEDEYSILKSVESANLVKIYDVVRTENHLYIIYKFYPSDLQVYINTNGRIPEETIRKWALDILKGLSDLHLYDILHRDLKPANILLTDNNRKAVIGDFGICHFLANGTDNRTVGTLPYMAPETLESNIYTKKIDIYSYGLVLYSLCCEGRFSRFEMVQHGLQFRADISSELKEFVSSCVTKDPEQRPNVQELACSPFIKQQMQEVILQNRTVPMILTESVHAENIIESIIIEDFGKLSVHDPDESHFHHEFLKRIQDFIAFCYYLNDENLIYFVLKKYEDQINETTNYIKDNSLQTSNADQLCFFVDERIRNPPKIANREVKVKTYFQKLLKQVNAMKDLKTHAEHVKAIIDISNKYLTDCRYTEEILKKIS